MAMFDEEDKAGNAMLMFQKGLSSFATADQNQKELLLQQTKAKYDQLNKEKDDYAAIFGNKEFSPQYRKQAYNSMVAIDKTVNPGSQMMPMDSWDAVSENLSKDIGAARKMLVEGTIDRKAYNKMVMGATATAYQTAKSKDEVSNISDIEKNAMASVNGSSATVKADGKEYQGTINPMTNAMEPYDTPNGPAETTNIPEATFQKEYGEGGLKDQEMGVKKQNANTASALLGAKAQALDASTKKTYLDALNSSDKAKSNAAIQQFMADVLPPELAALAGIDMNKLQNDKLRKAIIGSLTDNIPQAGTDKPAAETTKPAPKGGATLKWNGVDYPDTPGNRAWLDKQKTKGKK